MITIDLTMLIQIANMLLLIVVLNAVLYKPIRSIIDERQKKIGGLDEGIDQFKKNAALRLDEFGQKMKDARIRAKKEYEAARNAALAESSEKLAGIRKEVDAQKTGQLAEIEKQFAAAQAELQGQISGFAGEMAGKVLGRAL
ncbi:MAG: ATP synthase F0 subunit B [Desulfobulbaceae bacterium]|nr:ATP synthase F0 subunit B [Desulfobulbaceae bacterium]HIJ90851.1 ATP synthase F0 subunit B [Deltaproteobacteria bacterium]